MPHRPDLETHLLRKELIRTYHRQGLPVAEMVRRLDQTGLFLSTQGYNARYSVVLRLLRAVQREDSRRFRILQEDSERALIEYVERQSFLYCKAIECGDYRLARDLSKDIARGHGVVTEEPVRVETDILVQMGQAFAMAEKKMLERKQRAALSSPVPALDIVPSLGGNGKKE